MNKLKFNSILSRLFISFLCVMAPIVIIGVLMFSWEKQTIMNQIRESSFDDISFLQNNLENEVQNIKLLEYNLLSDSSLQNLIIQYADVPKYEYYTLIANVQQRLQIMKNSNNYIRDVVVYIPGMGHTISATTGYLDFDDSEYGRLTGIQSAAQYPLIIDRSGMFSMVSFPLSGNAVKKPLYLVNVVLDQDKIRAFLGKFSKYNDSGSALFDYTSAGWVYGSRNKANYPEEPRLEGIAGADGANRETTGKIDGKDYYITSVYSRYLNAAFVQYVPMEAIFRTPNQYGTYLWFYTVLSLLIMAVYSFSTYKFVKYPINIILKAFRKLEQGDLGAHVQFRAAREFNDLFEGFNRMVYRLNDLIDRVYRQELYAKKSELKQLQSQINPHFLYNSYFMLHRMIKDRDMEDAEQLSSYIGNYFRYITRDASEEIPLRKEFEHAYSYAQIQQMRFSERLAVEADKIPEKYGDIPVLRMILQPIVENSFEHGVKTAANKGLVRIGFQDTGDGLLLVVEDSGGRIGDEDITALQARLDEWKDGEETTGIVNVHRRLQLRYGPRSGIRVSRSGLGGLRVDLLILTGNEEKIG